MEKIHKVDDLNNLNLKEKMSYLKAICSVFFQSRISCNISSKNLKSNGFGMVMIIQNIFMVWFQVREEIILRIKVNDQYVL